MKKELKALVDSTNKDGTFDIIASTESMDRDGDTLKASDWDLKSFKANPVILPMHNSRELPVGKAVRVWIEKGILRAKIKFASSIYDYAKLVESMYTGGFMKAFSVGYMYGENKGDKNELLEISTVPVPSNREALITLGYKTVDETKDKVDEKELKKWMVNTEEKDKPVEVKKEEKKEVEKPETPKEPTKLKAEEDVKDMVRNAIGSCKQSAEVLEQVLHNTESVKHDKAIPKTNTKVVIKASPPDNQRRKAKIAIRVLQSLLKDFKNNNG